MALSLRDRFKLGRQIPSARIAKVWDTHPAGVDNLYCTSNSLTDTLP